MSIESNILNQKANPEKRKVTVEDVAYFSETLKEARRKIGKSQAELALAIGVELPSLRRWEEGQEFPEEARLTKIAEVYQIDYEILAEAYKISKEARQIEKDVRSWKKKPVKTPGPDTEVYVGEGRSRRISPKKQAE